MLRILIIDDEEIICQGIQSMIKRINNPSIGTVLYTTDGFTVGEIIPEFKPDIVISDIRMPDINGLEVIEKIQRIKKNCKFVILSGYDDFSYAKTALKLGVVDYLLKPADLEELEGVLNRIVELLNNPTDESPADTSEENHQNEAMDEKSTIGLAKKYIRQNFSKDIDMAVVSNFLSVNYFYFSKLFKKETGMNFSDYLISVRMEMAKKLLEDPTYKIYEISGSVGYDNPKNFTRIFRSCYGFSPEQYRKIKCQAKKGNQK